MEAALSIITPVSVIPAKAGIHHRRSRLRRANPTPTARKWIPAFAGMTVVARTNPAGN
jgi:hypothetical protein